MRCRADWATHLVLILGVAVFAFPIYVTFIAATHDAGSIGRGDMSLLPGPYLWDNLKDAWASGAHGRSPQAAVADSPGSSTRRPSPERNAFGAHVIGSTAMLRREISGSGSPVKSCT